MEIGNPNPEISPSRKNFGITPEFKVLWLRCGCLFGGAHVSCILLGSSGVFRRHSIWGWVAVPSILGVRAVRVLLIVSVF